MAQNPQQARLIRTAREVIAGPLVGGIQAVRHLRFHLFDNPFRLVVVDLASGADQTRLLRVLRWPRF